MLKIAAVKTVCNLFRLRQTWGSLNAKTKTAIRPNIAAPKEVIADSLVCFIVHVRCLVQDSPNQGFVYR